MPASSVASGTRSTSGTEAPADVEPEVTQTKKEKDKREILLVAAVAQEPRLGRWMSVKKGVKSGVFVAHLKFGEEQKDTGAV